MNPTVPAQSPTMPSQNPAVPAQTPPVVQTVPQEVVQTHPSFRIYGHSSFLYWWPVWVVGFAMTLFTYFQGESYKFADHYELIHPSSNLGVLFFTTLFLVILITNFSVRGSYSTIVILALAFLTVLLAYFGLWDSIFGWVEGLRIHLNLGAYFWFSAIMFLTWCFAVFVVDHLSYWEVNAGQLTQVFIFGTSSKSFNTQGMVLEKHRSDLFRHWLLGLGSGDLVIRTTGAVHEEIDVPNVLFIGRKVEALQKLIAEEPE
jgi:hypothetical protein